MKDSLDYLLLLFRSYFDLLSFTFGSRPENERVGLLVAHPTLTNMIEVQMPAGGTRHLEVMPQEPSQDQMTVAVIIIRTVFQRRRLDLFELNSSQKFNLSWSNSLCFHVTFGRLCYRSRMFLRLVNDILEIDSQFGLICRI